jgi:D-xylonolactonase
MPDYQLEALVNAHCQVGENPLWDARRGMVYWTDIFGGRLFRYDANSGEWDQFYDGPQVGGFTLQADGNLLLFRNREFAVLHEDGEIVTVTENIDVDTGRFNDVFADPEGRVYAGTMGTGDNLNGGLFMVDVDGNANLLFQGTTCSNGMGFTPDLTQMYWTDTTGRTIYIFDYDRATGALSNRTVWLRTPDEWGMPDGMIVDAVGCVWSAFYAGSAIRRFSPAGELLDTVEMPVPHITSLCAGGDDLCDLYITTAGGEDGSDTADGTLYRLRVEIPGGPEFESRIGIG